MTQQTYDYIIVGAGTAGCVLANRLSANSANKVLLLEAGGKDSNPWIKVPLGYAFTFSNPAVNWRYHAAPDAGLNGRIGYWPRGRVIGGSSSINAMAYMRGLPHDFDDWVQAGATGWGWTTAKATYDSIEQSHSPDGPVVVSDLSQGMHPFSARFLDAARDMGWAVLDDLNGAAQSGLGYYRSTVRNGRRWSAADAFLRPALGRSNLHVLREALVEKITLNGRRASGVVLRHRGGVQTVTAAREVILAAGAINSPQILQLSGIGDAGHLKSLGIAVQHNLAEVGQGLQDHLAVAHYYRANVPTLNNRLGNRLGQMLAGMQYILTRRGPLSVPVNQVGGYAFSGPDAAHPDVQIYCNPASYLTRANGKPRVDRAPGFLLCAQPSRPTSRGHVKITSADPAVAPEIQPNSLSTEADRTMAIRASALVQNLALTPAMRQVTDAALAPDILGMDDAALLENFRANAGTVFHASCTCRMGSGAQESVLDAQLRVHGIAGLRVVDASAFPNITSGNTNAPVLMLASRAADMILAMP